MTKFSTLQRLLKEATQGEWKIDNGYHEDGEGYSAIETDEEAVLSSCDGCSLGECKNAQLIVEMKNQLPELRQLYH